MLYFLFNQMNEEIRNLEDQQVGASYNNKMKNFLIQVQQHRGVSSLYLNGDQSYQKNMQEKQAEIAATIEKIKALEAQYGESLGTTERWSNIEQEWIHIQDSVSRMDATESFRQHTRLISQILDLLVYVGDASQLKTMTNIDGAYMSEGILKTLPQLSEQLGQMRSVGSGVAALQFLATEQNIQLISLSDKTRDLVADTGRQLDVITAHNPDLKDQLEPLFEDVESNVNDFLIVTTAEIVKATQISIDPNEYFDTATEVISNVVALYDANTNILNAYLAEHEQQLKFNRALILALISISLLLTVYLFAGFYMSVKKSIASIEHAAGQLAEGDLTTRVRLQTRDELSYVGQAFNKMAETFHSMIHKTRDVAEQVAASSQQLNASAEQTSGATEQITNDIQSVAQGTETQLRGTEESARSLEEMTSGIQQSAEKISTISELSGDSMHKARDGKDYVRQTVNQMEQISSSVDETDKTIRMLDQRSKEIEKILEVITGIAEQTNLLALNAAIEAARAGEHGRGFAVVADEVRQLAEQSAESAGQIGALVSEIQKDMHHSVQAMDTVKSDVGSGREQVQETEQKFNEIFEAMQQITEQIENVSATTQQISAGAQQVSASVNQVSEIARDANQNTQNVVAATEEQLASMEEITASANSLTEMAEELQALINRFKV